MGFEYCNPGWSYGPKRREYHFVKEGKGTLTIEGHTFHIHKNQCFIVPAGEVSLYSADKKEPWKYSWIGFLGIESSRYVQQLISNNNFVIDIKNATIYEQQIRRIISLKHNSLASALKMTGITYQLFGNLIEEVNDFENVKSTNSLATRAKRYMDLNYYDSIKIKDIADFLNVNVNYLSSAFKEEFNLSPKQYLMKLKIRKAKKLLSTTNSTITVVANSVGFNDSLAFSKVFKQYTQFSPSSYRKKMIDSHIS
ncbi:AraC family transcriptional regulator [Lactobacillus gallinarum]|uniref:AraC family transcriptional regulator n=1 Tax=Lactobacillus gallinarum TaxID=52242 RepID=UPI0019560866|nr:AraC family transcriptional regulator [Lactobacillus gallinarum]MBM6958758.1 AraC family transcriptional regulator [Lactobacillus gallinarum]